MWRPSPSCCTGPLENSRACDSPPSSPASRSEAQPLLDAMRRDGVRMQNTFKNVGKAGYAFNALQRLLLPASLRAPKDTTVSGLEA